MPVGLYALVILALMAMLALYVLVTLGIISMRVLYALIRATWKAARGERP